MFLSQPNITPEVGPNPDDVLINYVVPSEQEGSPTVEDSAIGVFRCTQEYGAA